MWKYALDESSIYSITGPDGQAKALPSEVEAFLYCAERNGHKGYPQRNGQRNAEYQKVRRAWADEQIAKAGKKKAPTPTPKLEPKVRTRSRVKKKPATK